MPVMDGLELLRRLHTCPVWSQRGVAKLVVSAHPLTEEALAQHGVYACFAKPLDLPRFKRTVREVLTATPTP